MMMRMKMRMRVRTMMRMISMLITWAIGMMKKMVLDKKGNPIIVVIMMIMMQLMMMILKMNMHCIYYASDGAFGNRDVDEDGLAWLSRLL